MSKELDRRTAIIEAVRAGRSAKEIISFFNYPKDVVYRLKKEFHSCEDKDSFTSERKTHKRRSDTVRTDDFVAEVQEKVRDKPETSMAALAAEMGVHRSTISKTIKDLGMKSYTLRRRQLLTDATKERRLQKAKALLNDLKHE